MCHHMTPKSAAKQTKKTVNKNFKTKRKTSCLKKKKTKMKQMKRDTCNFKTRQLLRVTINNIILKHMYMLKKIW